MSEAKLVKSRGEHFYILRTASWIVYFGALWSLILVITGGKLRLPFDAITLAYAVFNLPVGASFFHVVVMAVFGYAITTRKRLAWWFFVLLQASTLIAMGVGLALNYSDLDPYVLAISALHITVAVVLLYCALRVKPAFIGKLLPGAAFLAMSILTVGLGLVIALGLLLQHFFSRGPLTDEDTRWVITSTLGRHLATVLYGQTTTGGPFWMHLLLGTLSALVALTALVIFLRSQRMPGRSMEDDLFTRNLLARWGQDSLGYFATRDDRSIVRSPDGRAAVSYGVTAGVSVIGGDPLGDPNSWAGAIDEWLKLCAKYGWTPGGISLSERGARAMRQAGFSVRLMGDEAVINCADFDLDTGASKPLAQAVRRARRANMEIHTSRLADLDEETISQLRAAAENYRRGEERGFSMSLDRILTPEDRQTMMVWATDPEGTIHALLSFVPWGHHGLSLSLMRRHPSSLNGIIEAMVVELIHRAPQWSIERISLNFAMFRQVFTQGEAVDARWWDRVGYSLMRFASRFWQLHSLYESNARYNPQWVPRYLCFRGVPEMSYVGIGAGILEGFIPWFATNSPLPWAPTADYLQAVKQIEADALAQALPKRRLSDQEQVRRNKAHALMDAGRDPYPAAVALGEHPKAVRTHAPQLEAGQGSEQETSVGGRIRAIRHHGKVTFIEVGRGLDSMQVICDAATLGEQYEQLSWLDRGDLVRFDGTYESSRSGELSVRAHTWTIAAKALRPVPQPGDGLDPNTRSRERVGQLLATPTAVDLLRMRFDAVAALRQNLTERGYLEVETPILHPIKGGANARPFVTHLNAYSAEVFLRIAPELYLKRLAVAGFDAIFEMGRSFRNEGVDATHNPEFTSLEAYRAGADYQDMRELTEALIKHMATALHGEPICWRPAGSKGVEGAPTVATVDGVEMAAFHLGGKWPVVRVYDAISSATNTTITPDTEVDVLLELARKHQVELPPVLDHAQLVGALYDDLVEAHTLHPTFYTDFPAASSPLTRKHRQDPRLAERWDLVAFGMELGTAYTELTDPIDQRERFTEQSLAAAAGDPEAMSIDEQFLTDLEMGLAPTGGLGLGVDRLCMLLTGVNIRQLLAFPFVKPIANNERS
ncbi:MAG: bifunctional lysylphosphatidylglycerol synthetase/lysine--tRNA ligase LysX [Actinomycetaceae bacterium]|nr:bifunctional lysylphosphatidylglycerol synthetase/lysine--tRNA ligase LysX [Actinomycetaceae bacterium]